MHEVFTPSSKSALVFSVQISLTWNIFRFYFFLNLHRLPPCLYNSTLNCFVRMGSRNVCICTVVVFISWLLIISKLKKMQPTYKGFEWFIYNLNLKPQSSLPSAYCSIFCCVTRLKLFESKKALRAPLNLPHSFLMCECVHDKFT